MEHELKCWPEFFGAVATGRKRFEIRRAEDRTFAEHDTLLLREWDRGTETYSGRSVRVLVTYVLQGPPWLPRGVACLSLGPVHVWTKDPTRGVDVCSRCGIDEGSVNFASPDGFDRVAQCMWYER